MITTAEKMAAKMDSEQQDGQHAAVKRRSRLILLALFGIAFMPMAVAWLLYFHGGELRPASRTHNGVLLQPPLQLQAVGSPETLLGGRWALLVVTDQATCDDPCRQALYYARQVNIALGKDQGRMTRLLLTAQPLRDIAEVRDSFPGLRIVPVTAALVAMFAAPVAVEGVAESVVEGAEGPVTAFGRQRIFLVDPIGNIMMVYPPDAFGRPLLEDIKHLLRISNIG